MARKPALTVKPICLACGKECSRFYTEERYDSFGLDLMADCHGERAIVTISPSAMEENAPGDVMVVVMFPPNPFPAIAGPGIDPLLLEDVNGGDMLEVDDAPKEPSVRRIEDFTADARYKGKMQYGACVSDNGGTKHKIGFYAAHFPPIITMSALPLNPAGGK